jgi:paraquat-inducible protein A
MSAKLDLSAHSLVACHDCDLLYRVNPLPEGGVARCRRCDAVLYRHKPNSLNRTLALSIAGLVLFLLANVFPFLAFKLQGQVTETTLSTGIWELYAQDMWLIALLVLLTCIVIPFIQLLGMLYVLLPLKLNRLPWKLSRVFRFLLTLRPWGMMEVFMLGILVSVVKLGKMATIVPGIALWSFALLIVVLAAASAALDRRMVWDSLGHTHDE